MPAAKNGDSVCKVALQQDGVYSGVLAISSYDFVGNLFVNNVYCFDPASFKVAEGGSVQVYFGASRGAALKCPETFKYDSKSNLVAYYKSWGIATDVHIELQSQPFPNEDCLHSRQEIKRPEK